MRKLLLILALPAVLSCEKEVVERKLTKSDSIKIYEALSNDKELKETEKYLDSIMNKNPKLFKNIKKLTDDIDGLEKYYIEDDL